VTTFIKNVMMMMMTFVSLSCLSYQVHAGCKFAKGNVDID